MGVRFNKSVKLGPGVKVNFSKSGMSTSIGPRGFTTSIGKRGVYQNVGIPGTGLSYRRKVSGKKSQSKGRTSGVKVSSHGSNQTVPAAVREWQSYTGQTTPSVSLGLDELGNIILYDDKGLQITDQSLISIIKRTPQYKSQIPELKQQQQYKVRNKLEVMKRENDSFIKTYMHSSKVLNRRYYEVHLARLVPEVYEPEPFVVPMPTPSDIRYSLSREADSNVKGMPWKLKKLKEQYCAERYQERLNNALIEWNKQKVEHERQEKEKAIQLNEQYRFEYEELKTSYEKALKGDVDYIEDVSEQWISSCELPVDISTQFEYRVDHKTLMVDLDLPEIEDLPNETAVQLANGNMKVKDKSQKTLRVEYAECIFGLIVFVASNLFNVSPCIETIVISGYTQRRNRVGDIVDEYILSVKLPRDGMYDIDYKEMNPETFCLSFENRCKLSTTKVFKAIEPFE